MADDKKTDTAAEAKAEEVKTDAAATTETPAEETKEFNLSDNAKKVMEMVEQMNVLELSELVKALEDKFGVSAAAPVAMMAGAPAAGAEAEVAEAKSEYDVVITAAGDQKMAVIKAVRALDQSLGLIDAKNKVEEGEAVILTAAKTEDAEEAKKQLEEAGATVELR